MSRNEPEEIIEARRLLSEFEKAFDPSDKSDLFNEAFEILNDYLDDEPEDKFSKLANNIKTTYAKKLLNSFPEGESLDLVDWLEYLVIIMKNMKEFTPLLDADEILHNRIKTHCSFWAEDIKKIIS